MTASETVISTISSNVQKDLGTPLIWEPPTVSCKPGQQLCDYIQKWYLMCAMCTLLFVRGLRLATSKASLFRKKRKQLTDSTNDLYTGCAEKITSHNLLLITHQQFKIILQYFVRLLNIYLATVVVQKVCKIQCCHLKIFFRVLFGFMRKCFFYF